jgi:ABC-type branched-subunit amino acid transport system ATPase component
VAEDHGAGVLLVDHNMSLVLGVCDHVHVLDRGRTLAHGTPAQIREDLDVTEAYLGGSGVGAHG